MPTVEYAPELFENLQEMVAQVPCNMLEGSVVPLEPVRQEDAELFWDVAKNDLEGIFRWRKRSGAGVTLSTPLHCVESFRGMPLT